MEFRRGRSCFLVLGDCFVQRQEGAGEGGPGLVFLMEPGEESYFVFCWRAGEESSESKGDFFFEAPGVFFEKLSEVFGDLDEHGVVHEGKGLKRGVGAVAFGKAGFAGSAIEGGEKCEGGGALLVDIDAATVAVDFIAGLPFTAAVGDFRNTRRLGWTDGLAEHLFGEKAGGLEGGVTDDFGFEALTEELFRGARFDFGILLVSL